MDIKKMLLEIVNDETNFRYSFMAIEKLVYTMMEDYLRRQNKRIFSAKMHSGALYDMLLPDGIDNVSGTVAVDIKIFRNINMLPNRIYDWIGRIALGSESFDELLIIIINEIPEKIRRRMLERVEQLRPGLHIWDVDDLVKIFESNEELFIQTYNNLSFTMLQDAVSRGIARRDEVRHKKRNEYIERLSKEYRNDNIVLFLGAGASSAAKIATWDSLISELFVELVDKQLSINQIQMGEAERENILKEVALQHGNSPLLQTRFLRNGFDGDFEQLVSEILYKKADDTSDLLEEIGQLCIPNRGKLGIQAIVNYNFDDLVEKNLTRLRVRHHSIYGEGMMPGSEELGIYHVHGFLPQNRSGYENLTKSLLVFSEEGYHKLMMEPYHWANISQLNFMMNNTCIFIGLSMTDPNMRRLLEVAAQKKSEEDSMCRHFAIMRRFHMKGSEENDAIKSFEGVNESLQESFFRELGVNVIWVDEYCEIPNLLRQIKGRYDSY